MYTNAPISTSAGSFVPDRNPRFTIRASLAATRRFEEKYEAPTKSMMMSTPLPLVAARISVAQSVVL